MGRITASRTQLKGDPVYDSILASKFINCMMWDGKKTVAQRVFYDCLAEIKKRVPDQEPIDVFTEAIENVKPQIEVRSNGNVYRASIIHSISVIRVLHA